MQRPSAKLIPLTFALAATFMSSPARAQVRAPLPDGGVVSCEPVERELTEAKRALGAAEKAAESAQRERATCAEQLESTNERAAQASAETRSCVKEKDQQCSSTSALVDDLLRSRPQAAREAACVGPEQRQRLEATLSSWSNAATWLAQLGAYDAGETDVLLPPRGGSTPLDRTLSRLARSGHGGPLGHRRLLVEALRLVAPRWWDKLRAGGGGGGGGGAIDAWFTGNDALDARLVEEAERAPTAATGPAGPPLAASLRLVMAYQLVARCTDAAPAGGECVRARQLQQLLESTGPLVVQRRTQEIWATECTSVGPEPTLGWLADLGPRSLDTTEVDAAIYGKLLSCYLDDNGQQPSLRSWIASMLPDASKLTGAKLQRADGIRARVVEDGPEETCAVAVRAMREMPTPTRCEVPTGRFRDALTSWARLAPSATAENGAPPPLLLCAEFAHLVWQGKPASIASSFARPPSVDDMVATADRGHQTPMAKLRELCADRRGEVEAFPAEIAALATIGRGLGDATDGAPFRIDPAAGQPLELSRFQAARGVRSWLSHVVLRGSACTAIGLDDDRCRTCQGLPAGAAYDCTLATRLDEGWNDRTHRLLYGAAAIGLCALLVVWARRFRGARRAYASWLRETAAHLDGLGLAAQADRMRWLVPSRHDALALALPVDGAWERWGSRAAVVRAPPGPRVLERDVNHAAVVARRIDAGVVLLEHDDDASPDLSAIRATLEWAAKGGSRAIQVLPIAVSRARWSQSANDLLDLAEESSLRGNPFELRGRITSSTQFFNRERLVSGLLASAQTGQWVVVTGLRRFGKSSLSLEVARRLPGPSAYADLSGFAHEIGHVDDAGAAASGILRYVCLRLLESARARWPDASMPEPPSEGAPLDAAALTLWFRDLSRACRDATSGRAPPMLVILDEVEQALAVGPARLAHALDVLAIVVGRLKSAVGDVATNERHSPVGVLLASALHPLLWAPLRTLANQSIMGSFERACVPCLTEEAATSMMRSLGSRQGIRFKDAALAHVVRESQGVPLLLRRLGSSILELYDPERARQGSLGAVEIGVEGASEALEREVREGAPLRVWIETEICEPRSPAGAILRLLAREGQAEVARLTDLAKRMVAEAFVRTGVDATLTPDETARRTEEAASVMLRLLGETGLLEPIGDLTAPEGYALPDGVIRRVLAVQPSLSAYPSARPAP